MSAPTQAAEVVSASARVAAVAADLRAGRMALLSGGVGREDEASLVLAAEFTSAEAINFMAKEARGLICLALSAERCDQLGIGADQPARRRRRRVGVHGLDRVP